ncbi:MAG: hypothetical protein K0R51_3251 [Cytophagaceae bacterium]|jgi:hypothetical protein|nr:hypothetical protein [Cytophagaceae bacterium]
MNTSSAVSFLSKKLFRSQVIGMFCILTLGLLSSCKKDIQDPLLLDVNPSYLVMDVTGGANLPLTINASGPKNLVRFKIEAQDNTNTKVVLLDSMLSWGSKFSLLYNYTVPTKSNNFSLVLFFTVLDSEGNTAQTTRTLNVTGTSTPPTEKTGLKLSTKYSGNSDAYDLLNETALMSALDAASLQDIVDVATEITPADISYSWKSGNGSKFVSFNGFNYANATKETIEAAFASGTAVSQVNSLAAGSIVIVQTNRGNVKRYYAIQITTINEDDTVANNDFYLFNMKY